MRTGHSPVQAGGRLCGGHVPDLRTGGGEPGGDEEITDASDPLSWQRRARGSATSTHILRRKMPEVFLTLQGPLRHLFEPVRMKAVAHIQERVEAYWQEAKKTGTAP